MAKRPTAHLLVPSLVVCLVFAGVGVAWLVRGAEGTAGGETKAAAVRPSPPVLANDEAPADTVAAPAGSSSARESVANLPATPRASTPRELTSELREALKADPERAVLLGRWAGQTFPDSGDAPERASIVVQALMRMGRAEEATSEAIAMQTKYPDTEWARDVKRHMLDIPSIDTGAHTL
jgi:hypothetical protein